MRLELPYLEIFLKNQLEQYNLLLEMRYELFIMHSLK
jgi:hypothetical protein